MVFFDGMCYDTKEKLFISQESRFVSMKLIAWMTNAKCILFTWQSMEINKDKVIDNNVISATRTADVVEKTRW